MIRPVTTAIDRIASFTTGAVLLTLGSSLILWPTNFVALPAVVSITPLLNASHQPWWPWALAGAGVALILCAILWLRAHLPTLKHLTLRVREPEDPGTITIDLDSLAATAAAALTPHPDVRTARGKAISDRGTTTVVLTATLHHPNALDTVIDTITTTSAHITTTTGDPTLAVRTQLHLPKAATRARLE